jgi:PBP1b-binding outer membrane lipoprotein LpoB
MKINKIKVLMTITGLILVIAACSNNTCPEGSTAIRDPEGNIIDCFDPLNVEEQNELINK